MRVESVLKYRCNQCSATITMEQAQSNITNCDCNAGYTQFECTRIYDTDSNDDVVPTDAVHIPTRSDLNMSTELIYMDPIKTIDDPEDDRGTYHLEHINSIHHVEVGWKNERYYAIDNAKGTMKSLNWFFDFVQVERKVQLPAPVVRAITSNFFPRLMENGCIIEKNDRICFNKDFAYKFMVSKYYTSKRKLGDTQTKLLVANYANDNLRADLVQRNGQVADMALQIQQVAMESDSLRGSIAQLRKTKRKLTDELQSAKNKIAAHERQSKKYENDGLAYTASLERANRTLQLEIANLRQCASRPQQEYSPTSPAYDPPN